MSEGTPESYQNPRFYFSGPWGNRRRSWQRVRDGAVSVGWLIRIFCKLQTLRRSAQLCAESGDHFGSECLLSAISNVLDLNNQGPKIVDQSVISHELGA